MGQTKPSLWRTVLLVLFCCSYLSLSFDTDCWLGRTDGGPCHCPCEQGELDACQTNVESPVLRISPTVPLALQLPAEFCFVAVTQPRLVPPEYVTQSTPMLPFLEHRPVGLRAPPSLI